MPTRRDSVGAAIPVQLVSFIILCGFLLTGCDKVQIPQMGPPAAVPASTPGVVPAANATPGTTPVPTQAPTPTANANPDPKQAVTAFLQKAATYGQIEDSDLLNVTKLTAGLDQVQELKLSSSKITDVGIATLSKFPRLRKVELAGTPVTNTGIAVVKDMPELRVLGLGNTIIDDRGMVILGAQPGIKELILSGTKISDTGLNELENLKDLEVLDVSHTSINGSGFAKFKGHKQLRVLHAQHSSLENEAMKFLVNCPLEELNVDVTHISDPGMVQIARMSKLRKLTFEFCGVTDFGISKMVVMKDLEFISARNNGGISNLLFAKLQKCKNLKTVIVAGTAISGNDIAKLRKLIPGVTVTN